MGVPYGQLRAKYDGTRKAYFQLWHKHAQYWNNFKGQKVVIKYEDLKSAPQKVMKTVVLPFLGVKLSDNILKRLKCAVDASAMKTTKRKHTYIFKFTARDHAIARS